jgi:hypothetical protein
VPKVTATPDDFEESSSSSSSNQSLIPVTVEISQVEDDDNTATAGANQSSNADGGKDSMAPPQKEVLHLTAKRSTKELEDDLGQLQAEQPSEFDFLQKQQKRAQDRQNCTYLR